MFVAYFCFVLLRELILTCLFMFGSFAPAPSFVHHYCMWDNFTFVHLPVSLNGRVKPALTLHVKAL